MRWIGARLRRSRRRDERGAVAVLVGLMMVVVLGAAAFTVDLGQQRVGRADMQSLADVVAMDLARELNGRSYATLNPLMPGLAAKSEARNQSVIGYANHLPVLTVTLGTWNSAANPHFTAVTSGVPTAVRVDAQTTVGFAFGGITGAHSGNATRTAYGTAANEACFSLGSYAARINSANSVLLNAVLNKALGGSLNLSAVSYQGLANANVTLQQLAVQLGVGTVNQLLTTSVSLSQLYLATAQVLQQNGDTADATILNTIAASISIAHNISLGSLVSAASGSGAAETASVNVLNLLQGSAQIANGASAIAINGLAANLGLASATTSLNLISPPTPYVCDVANGGRTASTAQVGLSVTGTLTPPSLLGLTVSNATTNVSVSAASATGNLTGITCGALTTASPSGEDVTVKSALVGAGISQTLTISGNTANSGLLGLLSNIVSVQVTGSLTISVGTSDPATGKIAQIRVPNSPTSFALPIDTGSGSLGLTNNTVTVDSSNLHIKVKALLGLVYVDANASDFASILNSLVSSLTSSVLNPVISGVNSTLLQPLEGMLGLSVGGVDVFGSNPSCGKPKLVG